MWTIYRADGGVKVADGFDNIDGGHPDATYGGTTEINGGGV